MDNRTQYLNEIDSNLKKYREKISKMNNVVKNSSHKNKDILLSEDLEKKYQKAEDIFKKLKSSSQENFAEIKAASTEIFDSLSQSFDKVTQLISEEDLNRLKKEAVKFGVQKASEAGGLVKKHPLTFLTGAFGVGILIGLFFNRFK